MKASNLFLKTTFWTTFWLLVKNQPQFMAPGFKTSARPSMSELWAHSLSHCTSNRQAMTSIYSFPLCTDQQINRPGQQFPPNPWMLSLCLSCLHELRMATKWEWEKWAQVEFQRCRARHCKKASALRWWAQCMRWFASTAWATVIYPQRRAHQHRCSPRTMQASSRPPNSNHHVSNKTN